MNNPEKTILFLTILMLNSAFAVIVEVTLKPPGEMVINLYLPDRSGIEEDEALNEIAKAVRTFGWLEGEVLPTDKYNCNNTLRVIIPDWTTAADSFNFVDYKFNPSFYQQKYYLKILLNRTMLESDFFREVLRSRSNSEALSRYFTAESSLELFLSLPGRYQQTDNVKLLEDGRLWKLILIADEDWNETITIRTRRFLPEIYLTTFGALLVLAVIIMFLFRSQFFPKKKRNPA
ncbi:MAG: hypothetical protein Kow0037_00480 [Calditrichia bacterium]